MEKTADFTEGRILSRLLRFALPVLAALFLQAMYGAVDLMVVGGAVRSAHRACQAVSTGSQIMQTVTSLITGLAMGITILVGQKIGERRPERAGDVIGSSGICLFGVLAAVLTVLMILGAGFLAGLMHAPDEAFSQTVDYIRICSAGAVFIIAYNVLGSIFRGIGDSRMPLFTVAAACVFNIGGDLLPGGRLSHGGSRSSPGHSGSPGGRRPFVPGSDPEEDPALYHWKKELCGLRDGWWERSWLWERPLPSRICWSAFPFW